MGELTEWVDHTSRAPSRRPIGTGPGCTGVLLFLRNQDGMLPAMNGGMYTVHVPLVAHAAVQQGGPNEMVVARVRIGWVARVVLVIAVTAVVVIVIVSASLLAKNARRDRERRAARPALPGLA